MYSVIFGSTFSEPFIFKLGMLEVVSHTYLVLVKYDIPRKRQNIVIKVEFIWVLIIFLAFHSYIYYIHTRVLKLLYALFDQCICASSSEFIYFFYNLMVTMHGPVHTIFS